MDAWFGGSSEVGGGSSSHSGRHGTSSDKKRHSSSRSILGDQASNSSHHGSHHSSSRPSFFGFGRSPSYYKRSPRKSYLNKLYTQLRRLLRDLTYYLKKNPLKVFVLVILPLVTGGLLSALLARLGIRLPRSFEVFLAQLGGHAPRHSSPSAAASRSRSSPSGLNFERESYEGPLGGVGNAIGAMGGVGGLMGLAKMFA